MRSPAHLKKHQKNMKNMGLPYDPFHSRDIHLYVMSSQKTVAHQHYTNNMHTRKAMLKWWRWRNLITSDDTEIGGADFTPSPSPSSRPLHGVSFGNFLVRWVWMDDLAFKQDCKQTQVRRKQNYNCKAVLSPVNFVVTTPGPQSTWHELSTKDTGT